tara:strand:- start:170 stop:382 length:213 start_codon:yes stop_codon:yes gene_type:complete
MTKFENLLNRIKLRKPEPEVVYINEEEYDMITDEIEKSLLEIKSAYGIPTEEIEKSVLSRRKLRKNKNTK